MAHKIPKIPFKAGDDFLLTLTVNNKSSEEALAAASAVIEAQALYNAELAQTVPDSGALATLLGNLEDAQDAYDLAIIVDITGWNITSSMRWLGKLIDNFTVTLSEPLIGKFTLECSNSLTQLWKPRVYDVDVQFVISGRKSSSQTFQIDVKKDITIEEVDV